jgi:NAD(P)-dependent dehydrogenase (short-subunit alcohol dehydrogenase family)
VSRFAGKRIVITGATSGIGRAGAVRIAAEGGMVIATGRDASRLAALREALPSHCLVLANDAARPEDAAELRRVVADDGPIHGLWLNAGYAEVGPIDDIDAAFFDRMMAANVRGPVLEMAQLSDLLADSAAVVVTASTAVYEGSAMASVYAATKGALLALVRCWASALGGRGVRVNSLVPGPIDTEFRAFMADEFRHRFEADVIARLALPRIGTADEAAAVALFLLSDDATFVTGAQYAVDGGLVMQ